MSGDVSAFGSSKSIEPASISEASPDGRKEVYWEILTNSDLLFFGPLPPIDPTSVMLPIFLVELASFVPVCLVFNEVGDRTLTTLGLRWMIGT